MQLAAGIGLLVLSFRMGPKKTRKPQLASVGGAGRDAGGGDARNGATGGRLARWRARAMAEGSARGLVGLALTAATVEVGTMLPYLAAIGLVTTADLPGLQVPAVMAAYCLVMIIPALVMLGLRMAAGARIEPLLERISRWLANSETMAWVVGIIGFLIARDAVARLGLLVWLGD
jgi:hypothetical protein